MIKTYPMIEIPPMKPNIPDESIPILAVSLDKIIIELIYSGGLWFYHDDPAEIDPNDFYGWYHKPMCHFDTINGVDTLIGVTHD